ncbi:MAG TPA: septum formation family protein [Galbitalea sp.]|jgi:hypothetical protein
MSGDDDEFDPSDWLTGQFETGEVPKPKSAGSVVGAGEEPDEDAATEPAADAPAAGGFNWDLKPSSAVQPPPVEPPVDPGPEPDLPPTEAYTPPPLVRPTGGSHVAPPPAEASASIDAPTQAMSLDEVADAQAADPADMPTQAYTPPKWEPFVERTTPVFPPTPAAPVAAAPAWAVAPAAAPSERPTSFDDPTSALDTLFGEHKFEEYEEVGVLQAVSPLIGERPQANAASPQHAPLTTLQKTLMWVAGGLVAILALVALFLLGEKLGAASATAPVPATSSAASAAPQPASTTGPVAPGSFLWNQLNGGECLQPFTSAWATKFTVVDCGTTHLGQLLFKGTLPDASGSAYPTSAQFAAEIRPLCTSSKVIDYDAAKAVSDLQVSFTYPATEKDWTGGSRTYYCFVSRASRGALPSSFAVAQ